MIERVNSSMIYTILFLADWGLNSGPIPCATLLALFCDFFFFKIESHELFAQAGLEL
jgi:hypothetical protein